jgi:hypothetical protein
VSQLAAKCPVQQGLEEVVEAAARGGLLGLQGADLGDTVGELVLYMERREGQANTAELLGVDVELDRRFPRLFQKQVPPTRTCEKTADHFWMNPFSTKTDSHKV